MVGETTGAEALIQLMVLKPRTTLLPADRQRARRTDEANPLSRFTDYANARQAQGSGNSTGSPRS